MRNDLMLWPWTDSPNRASKYKTSEKNRSRFEMFPCGFHPGKKVLKARMPVEFPEDRTVFRDVRVMPETFPKRGLQPVDRQICLVDKGIAFADPKRPELDVSRTRQKIRIEAGFGIFRLSF